jgi:hypothetical protein
MPSTQHPDSYWVETGNPAPVCRPSPATEGGCRHHRRGLHRIVRGIPSLQAGIDAIVVEAEDVGWGASGRNGGMLPPRYKKGFASIAKTYGNETTRRLHAIVHEAVDTVETIVSDCALDCGFSRTGRSRPRIPTCILLRLNAIAPGWRRRPAIGPRGS